MSEDTPTAPLPPCDLAIIGGGAGGVLVAMQALRQATTPLRIVMIEPRSVLAQGVAYATTHGEHLLNVPAVALPRFRLTWRICSVRKWWVRFMVVC